MAIKIRAQHLEITNRRYKEKVRVGCFLVLALSAFLTLITGSKSVLFARTPFLKVDDPVSTVQALLSQTNQHYLEAINRLPDTTVSVLGVVNEVTRRLKYSTLMGVIYHVIFLLIIPRSRL